MAINMEAAQLVVGAALLNPRFRRTLFADPTGALAAVEREHGVPDGVRVSEQDRIALASIRARNLREFAVGVERLRTSVAGQKRTARVAHDELVARLAG